MNEGIHLDLDTWIVPGQIRKANLCRGLGNRTAVDPVDFEWELDPDYESPWRG